MFVRIGNILPNRRTKASFTVENKCNKNIEMYCIQRNLFVTD